MRKLSKEAEFFISKCYQDGQIMSISPYFNTVYEHEGKQYKFTQEVYEEVLASGKVRMTCVNKKHVNLMGVEEYKE